MTWIKCSEGLPDRKGDIIVKINGQKFLGIATFEPLYLHVNQDSFIVYFLPLPKDGIKGGWSLPNYYREPDEWMYVP